MTTDQTPVAEDHGPASARVPLPALGPVLAACWLTIIGIFVATWIAGDTTFQYQGPGFREGSALGTVVVVVTPLLVPGIPSVLRRRALPFLILAGMVSLTEAFFLEQWSPFPLLIPAGVLYVVGWLMLRGRGAKLLLFALAVPVLFLLGWTVSLALADRLQAPLAPYPYAFTPTVMVIVAVLAGALPVCIPLLVASFVKRAAPSEPTIHERPGSPAAPAVVNPTNRLAMASLVVGLVGGNVIAVVLGHVARSQIRRTHEDGAGAALAGLVLGYIGVALVIVALLFVWALISSLSHIAF